MWFFEPNEGGGKINVVGYISFHFEGQPPWSKSFLFFFFLNISVDRPKSLTGITAVIFVIQAGQFIALE